MTLDMVVPEVTDVNFIDDIKGFSWDFVRQVQDIYFVLNI